MLPVSVVVPLQDSRRDFFEQFGRPSINANEPAELFVEDGLADACTKRNRGFQKATQPWVFFCDDDVVLSRECLSCLVGALRPQPKVAYAYCDHLLVRWPKEPSVNPFGECQLIRARPFSAEILKGVNYVPCVSMFRASVFPGWDHQLKRFQDWDVALRLLRSGFHGVYVPKTLFHTHSFGESITDSAAFEEAHAALMAKHADFVGER